MRPVFEWELGSRSLQLGKRTLVMGVVNVTPDSFSDGGLYFERERAVEHALRLIDEGADILDIGGESTRPGARVLTSSEGKDDAGTEPRAVPRFRQAVSETEELERVIPVITAVKQARPEALISVDTYKAKVARAAVDAGAEMVNDVSGFRWDPELAKTVAQLKCGAVLMHMRGRPEEWRTLPPIGDAVGTVKRDLKQWVESATGAGVAPQRIALDPGFGFGKNFEENYALLAGFPELHTLGFPLLAGVSRKSFIGRTLARGGKDAVVTERLYGTLAVETALVLAGAHVIRTHDVKAGVEAAQVADAILRARP